MPIASQLGPGLGPTVPHAVSAVPPACHNASWPLLFCSSRSSPATLGKLVPRPLVATFDTMAPSATLQLIVRAVSLPPSVGSPGKHK